MGDQLQRRVSRALPRNGARRDRDKAPAPRASSRPPGARRGDLGQQLRTAQGREEALAGERIVEARRIADQHHAADRGGATRYASGPMRHAARSSPRRPPGRRQMAEVLHARREERLQPVAETRGIGERHHQAHVHAGRRDRIEDRVVRRVDEDLAEVGQALEPAT